MNNFMQYGWQIILLLFLAVVIVLLVKLITNNKKPQNNEEVAAMQQTLLQMQAEINRLQSQNSQQMQQTSEQITAHVRDQISLLNNQVNQMSQSNEQRFERLRSAVNSEMQQMRESNSQSIEAIRSTVGEKLEVSLENKLTQSFSQVGERLEQVYKGLGEMQSLAAGVGDLQKLLRNVKIRGTWGEVQLGSVLEQLMVSEQYAANVAVNPASPADRVEYAICLPGKDENEENIWLPIDAKCPIEDYERLMAAQEAGDTALVAECAKALRNTIKKNAETICKKYIAPPATTDFAIMYLPIEGLYAEALQAEGLQAEIQQKYRVTIAGPTTLAAMLNSLQMGFRTLAIEKQASQVWQTLATVKTEFAKFDESLNKTHKKLQETTNLVESVQQRSRVMQRKMRSVESISEGSDTALEAELAEIDEPLD